MTLLTVLPKVRQFESGGAIHAKTNMSTRFDIYAE
jgi:hypothetical protein